MLWRFIASLSVASAFDESPKVSKYDECVGTPKRLQESLYAIRPDCNETSTYCKECYPSLLDILDKQAECCKFLEGKPDPGMRDDAHKMCTDSITTFKKQGAQLCDGKMRNVSSPMSKCARTALDAKLAVYTSNANCMTSKQNYCAECYIAELAVTKVFESCCADLEGDAHTSCLEAAAKDHVDVKGKCLSKHAAEVDPSKALAAATQCHDITDNETLDEHKKCYTNIRWAREHGLKEHPEYYTNAAFLNENSSTVDFQQALFSMKGANAGESWGCPMPCSASPAAQDFMKTTDAAVQRIQGRLNDVREQTGNVAPSYGAAAQRKKGMGVWSWLMIAIGLCFCMPIFGLCCSAFLCYESVSWIFACNDKPAKAKKNKKRSLVANEKGQAQQEMSASQTMQSQPVRMVPTNAVPMPMLQPIHYFQYVRPVMGQRVVPLSAAPVSAHSQYAGAYNA